jgi:type IV pilus assembly protein PilA
MPRLARTALPALLAVVACGGAPNPPASVLLPPTASASAPAPAEASAVVAAPAHRAPPEELLHRWPFGARPRLAVYADVGGLLRTDLGRTIIPSFLSLSQGDIAPEQARCLRAAADSVKDLIGGAEDDGGFVAARFDDTAFDPTPCLTAAGAHAKPLEGLTQGTALELHGTVVVHEPGLLLIGSERYVHLALHPPLGTRIVPQGLTLGADEYVAWSARFDEDSRAHGTLLVSSDRFRLAVEADVPSFIAGQVEDQVHAAQARGAVPGLEGEEGAIAASLLKSVHLTRDGSHLSAAFDLHEPPGDQARDLGAVAALGIAGVRKYLVASKSAEARNAVGQIAKDYATWWEREDVGGKPRARRKLVSFPPVPKTIPRGTKYQSTPADWKPWDALKFEMDQPQYYQYEVRASKDGNSADILARGDLDGDGKSSEFRLHIAIDRAKDVMVIAPSLEERDPEE